MKIPVYKLSGEVIKHIEISDSIFAEPFNEAVVHQAMVRQRANARQGTSSTKTRAEVTGSTKKLFRQKHLGFARAGSRKSPLRRGGGITFGPKPKNYNQPIPKKMRRLAIRCVLSAKAGDGKIKILEHLKIDEPKTKDMVKILESLGVGNSVLIATTKPERNVIKSAHNLVGIKISPADLLNVLDLLSYKVLLITETAVRRIEQLWGGSCLKEESNESLRSIAPPSNN